MTAQQLKNSILQMAVQGKLVPQDPTDEPASVLLERIRAEKEKLIKEGKIKKEKNPSVIFRGSDNLPYEKVGKEVRCIADEVPFDIPDAWEWVRLKNLCDLYTGDSINETEKKLKFTNISQGRFYIGTKDVEFDHTINYDNGVKIPEEYSKFRIAPQNAILLCIEGGSAGRKIAITNTDVCFGNKLCCFNVFADCDKKFIYYYLQSPGFSSVFKNQISGIIGGVSIGVLKDLYLPLPPLPEQKRIVAKIEELLPHIEEYGKAESKVSKLNAEFPEQLKKSILQWAIQGKLVPQNPEDESASVLLERIRDEKAKLIKEGKIKKDKNESVIFRRDNSHYEKLNGVEHCIDDEIPFEIPDNWMWVRLSTVSKQITDGEHKTPRRVSSFQGFYLLSARNIRDGFIALDNVDYVDKEEYDSISRRCNPKKNDILISCSGSVGRICVVEDDNQYVMVRSAAMASPIMVNSLYLMYSLQADLVQQQIQKKLKQAVQANLFQAAIRDLCFPLPPLEEQKRIVAEVERIFSIQATMRSK